MAITWRNAAPVAQQIEIFCPVCKQVVKAWIDEAYVQADYSPEGKCLVRFKVDAAWHECDI